MVPCDNTRSGTRSGCVSWMVQCWIWRAGSRPSKAIANGSQGSYGAENKLRSSEAKCVSLLELSP